MQQWIDAGGLRGNATTVMGIQAIHQRFCAQLPDELLWVQDPLRQQTMKVTPGELRQQDVQVGQHVAISSDAIPRFLERFSRVYSGLGKAESLLALAAAHHRLLWIHPFLDGNGRVARLMSHAMLMETLDSGSIWSVARGLARQEQTYKMHLANCDLPRRNALDGRGYLSEMPWQGFTRFFLETCLDQIALVSRGVITSPTSRAPLALAFPAKLAAYWLPGLFPAA